MVSAFRSRMNQWFGRLPSRTVPAWFSLRWLAVAMVAALLTPQGALAQPRPFTVHDLIAMDRLSGRVVARRHRVAFVVSALDLDANRRRTDLWLVGTDGTGLRRLTDHPASDTSPVWSRDGQAVYFLSTRSGSSQVWQLAVGGGEAQQVTTLPLDVGRVRGCRPTAAPGRGARGLRRLRHARVHGRPTEGTARARKAHRAGLRPPVHPALGHVEGRPPLAPVRRAGRRRRAPSTS